MNDKVETSHPSFSKTQQNFHKSSNNGVQSLLRPKATSSNFSLYTRSKRKLTEINVDLAQLQMKFDKFQNNLNMFMHCGNTNSELGNVSNFRVSGDNVQNQDVGQHQLLFDLNDFQEEVILQQPKKQEQSFLPQNQLKNQSFTEQEEQANQHNNTFINTKETAVNFQPLKKISQRQKTQQKSKSKGKSTSQNNLKKYNMQKTYAMRNFPIEYFENVELLFEIMNRKKNRVRNIHSTDGKYKKSKDRFASNKMDQNMGNQERETNSNRIRLRSEEKQLPQEFGIEKDKRSFMRSPHKQNQHFPSYLNKNCKTIRDPQQKPLQRKDRLIPVSKSLIKKKSANTTRQNQINRKNKFQSKVGELTGRQEYNSGKSPTNRHRLIHSPEYVQRMMQVKTADNFSKRQNCVQRCKNQVSSEVHFVTPLTTLRNTEADEEKLNEMQGIEEVETAEPYQVVVVEIDKLDPILSVYKKIPLKQKPYQYSEEQSFLKKINQNHPRKSRYCQCCAQAHDDENDMLRTPKKQKSCLNKSKSPTTTKVKNSPNQQSISRQLNNQSVCICNNRLSPARQVNQDSKQHSLNKRNISNNQIPTNKYSHQKLNIKSINFNSHNIPKTKSNLLKVNSTTEQMMILNKPEYQVDASQNDTNQRSASERKRRLQELSKPSRVNKDINKVTKKLQRENRVVSRQKSLRRLSNKNTTINNSTDNNSQNKVKHLFTVPPVESFLKNNPQQHSTQNIKKLIRKAIPTHLSQQKRIKDVSREVVQMKQFSQKKENDSLDNEKEEKQLEGQECNKMISSEQEDKKIQQQGNIETMRRTIETMKRTTIQKNVRQLEELVLGQQKKIEGQQKDSQYSTKRGEFILSQGENDEQDIGRRNEGVKVKRRQLSRSTFNPNAYIKKSQQHHTDNSNQQQHTGDCNQVMKKEDNQSEQQSKDQLEGQNKPYVDQIKEQQTCPNLSNQQTAEKLQQQLLLKFNIQNHYQELYHEKYQVLNPITPLNQQHFINTQENQNHNPVKEQQQYSNLKHHHEPKLIQQKLNHIDQTKTNPNYQENITKDKTDQQLLMDGSREQTVQLKEDKISNQLNQKEKYNSSQFQLQLKLRTSQNYNQYSDDYSFIQKSINDLEKNKQQQLSYNIQIVQQFQIDQQLQIVQQEVIQSVDRKHNTPRFNNYPLNQSAPERHAELTKQKITHQILQIEDKTQSPNIYPTSTPNTYFNTHLETKQQQKNNKIHSSPQTINQPIHINQSLNQSQRYNTQHQQHIPTPLNQSSLLQNNKSSLFPPNQTRLLIQDLIPQLTQDSNNQQLSKEHIDRSVQKHQYKIIRNSSEIKGTEMKGNEMIVAEGALASQKQYPLTYQNEKHFNTHQLTEIVNELELETDKKQSLSHQLYDGTRDVNSNRSKVKYMSKQLGHCVAQEIQRVQRQKTERILSSQQQNQELNTREKQSQDSFLSEDNAESNRDVKIKQYRRTNQNQQQEQNPKMLIEKVNLSEKLNYSQHQIYICQNNHSKEQIETIMQNKNTYLLKQQGESPAQSQQKLSNTKLSVHLIETQGQSSPVQVQQQEQFRSPLTKQKTIHPITSHLNKQQTSIAVLPDISKISNLPSDPHFPTHSHLNNKLSQLHLAKSSQQSLIQITLSNNSMEESGFQILCSNQINQIKSDEIEEKSVGKSQQGDRQERFQNQDSKGKDRQQYSQINPKQFYSSWRQNQLKPQSQNCKSDRVELLQSKKQIFQQSFQIRQKEIQQGQGKNIKKENNQLNKKQLQNHGAIETSTNQFSVQQTSIQDKFNSKSSSVNNRRDKVEQSEQKENRLSQGQNNLSEKDLEQVRKIAFERQTQNIVTQQAIQITSLIKPQEAKDSKGVIIRVSNIQNYQQKILTISQVNKQNSMNNINLTSNDRLERVSISEEDYLVKEYLDQLSSIVSGELKKQLVLAEQRAKQHEILVNSEQKLFPKDSRTEQLINANVSHQNVSPMKESLKIESMGNQNVQPTHQNVQLTQSQLYNQAHPIIQTKSSDQNVVKNNNTQQNQISSQKTYLNLKKGHEKEKPSENIESKSICVESDPSVNNRQTSNKEQITSQNKTRKVFDQQENSITANQGNPLQNPKTFLNLIEKKMPQVQDNQITESEIVKQIQSKQLQQKYFPGISEKPFNNQNALKNQIFHERPNLILIADTVRQSSDYILEKQNVGVGPCNQALNKSQVEQFKQLNVENHFCHSNNNNINRLASFNSQSFNPTHTKQCDPTSLKLQVNLSNSQGQKLNHINQTSSNRIQAFQHILESLSQEKLQKKPNSIHEQQGDQKSKQRVYDQLFQRREDSYKQTPIFTQQAFTQVENYIVYGNQNINQMSSKQLQQSSIQLKEKQLKTNHLKLTPEPLLTQEKSKHTNLSQLKALEADIHIKQDEKISSSQESVSKKEQPQLVKQLFGQFNTKNQYQINCPPKQKHSDKQHQHIHSSNKNNIDISECPQCAKYTQYHQQPQHYHQINPFMNPYMINPYMMNHNQFVNPYLNPMSLCNSFFKNQKSKHKSKSKNNDNGTYSNSDSDSSSYDQDQNQVNEKKHKKLKQNLRKRSKRDKERKDKVRQSKDDFDDWYDDEEEKFGFEDESISGIMKNKHSNLKKKLEMKEKSRHSKREQRAQSSNSEREQLQQQQLFSDPQQQTIQQSRSSLRQKRFSIKASIVNYITNQQLKPIQKIKLNPLSAQQDSLKFDREFKMALRLLNFIDPQHQFIKRLLEVNDTTQKKILWLFPNQLSFKPQSTFQPFQIIDPRQKRNIKPTEIKPKQVADYINLTINKLQQSFPYQQSNIVKQILQIITGSTLFNIKSSSFNKLKNLHKHENIKGFTFSALKKQLYEIIGSQQVQSGDKVQALQKIVVLRKCQIGKKDKREVESNLELAKEKLSGEESVINVKWQDFMKRFSHSLIGVFGLNYQLRALHFVNQGANQKKVKKNFVITMSLKSSKEPNQKQKQHCLLNVNLFGTNAKLAETTTQTFDKTNDQQQGSRGRVLVYQELHQDSNQYKYIGSGDLTFISMRVREGKYLVILQFSKKTLENMQQCKVIINYAGKSISLTEEKWTDDYASIMSAENTEFIKTNKV